MIPEERRLTDDRVLIITIVLVRGLTLRNLLIVVGIALYGTKVSNPYTEQVVRRIIRRVRPPSGRRPLPAGLMTPGSSGGWTTPLC